MKFKNDKQKKHQTEIWRARNNLETLDIETPIFIPFYLTKASKKRERELMSASEDQDDDNNDSKEKDDQKKE